MEILTGIIMVIALMSTVISKFWTDKMIIRLRKNVGKSETELRNARGQLKSLEAEDAIIRRKERTLNKQKERLEKRIVNHTREIKKLTTKK